MLASSPASIFKMNSLPSGNPYSIHANTIML